MVLPRKVILQKEWRAGQAVTVGSAIAPAAGWTLPTWIRGVAGLVLVPAGFGFGLVAMRQLTVAASFGLQGRLMTSGVYRTSCNPQCVGFIGSDPS